MTEQQNGASGVINGDHDEKASMLNNLQAGFDYLKDIQENEKTRPPNSVLPYFLSRVNVTVIDPTVSSISTSNKDNLFEKFANVFETLFDSSLTDVKYQLFRNNSKGSIAKLPVKLNVARSHGGGLLLDEKSTSLEDYVWERPYCYLYLASCDGLEHYRTKVKPSIQAFVSQLEASTINSYRRQNSGNAETTKSKKKHTPAPRYVIVYVPCGDRKPEENSPKKGFGSRLRKRMAAARGVDEAAVEGVDNVEESPEQFNLKLTKVERDILRRFNADFPNGHVCTLSTLNDSVMEISDDASEKEDSWQKIEWGVVQAAMGQAISFGFQDRCYRFDEELRWLDLQRRGDAKPDETSAGAEGLHLVNFFLVKESLAFTYEQMRLPNEALLQYEELRAFLPDPDLAEPTTTMDAWNGAMTNDALKIALSGDVLELRELLRSGDEMEAFSSIAQEYLFVRELALLFQMQKSNRIARLCILYIDSKFQSRKILVNGNPNADVLQKQLGHVQRRAFDFCWDFRIACDHYLASRPSPAFAKGVGDILEFARLRLVELGAAVFQETVAVRSKRLLEPVDEPWRSWEEPVVNEAENEFEPSPLLPDFLSDALSSSDAFSLHYLDLIKLIAESNELCGRHRLAARLRIERMEVLHSKGDKVRAAQEILSILNVFEQDMWSGCHFALLFRLATLQRNTSPPSEYLGTLVRCFGESVANVSPAKAVEALYSDLNAVLKCPSVKGSLFSSPPFIRPIFGLDGIKSKRSQGTDRNLVKRLYTVGDSVSVTVSLTSYIPDAIEVESVCVDLVPFRKYVAAMEDNVPIAETDVCKVLKTTATTALQSGENILSFLWLPKSSGQFIISSATVSWQGVKFKYTAKELRRPTIRIDIVPCEPTQSLEAFPSYILPGHDQRFTLKFSSGSDCVMSGKALLEGPPGIMFLPPDCADVVDSWVPSCEVDLPSCPPYETVSWVFTVRAPPSQATKPAKHSLSVVAKVSTSYKHGVDAKDEPGEDQMETQLETNVPLLEEPALSVVDCGLVSYSADSGLINATLKSNCPVGLSIKDWTLDVPDSMAIHQDGDFNGHLRNETIFPGDQISFCFEYTRMSSDKLSSLSGLKLQISMENDQGTSIKESLRLRPALPSDIKAKCLEGAVVPVQLSLSTTEAMVGTPLEIEYGIDARAVRSIPSIIMYSIDSDDEEWIVGGETGGPIKITGDSVQKVIAIAMPSRPGVLKSFPKLSLMCTSEGQVQELAVDLSAPSSFRSLPPGGHISVAFPTGMSRRASSRAVV